MNKNLSILAGKVSFKLAKLANRNGTALPGKVALKLNKDLLENLSKNCEHIILITGTNGKTTTMNISNEIFKGKYKVVSNLNGSNMIQGVLTPLIIKPKEKYDWGIFEVDEGSFPEVSKYITPDYILVTNFFRDQLDRYGEVENTINLVHDSIKPESTLILNGDAPSVLYFDDLPNKKIYYHQDNIMVSKGDTTVEEFIFCPKCGHRLEYEYINYGNIGEYHCPQCRASNPQPKYSITDAKIDSNELYHFKVNDEEPIKLELIGSYNLYNALGAITLAKEVGIEENIIKKQIENFKYEKGRMEKLNYNNKNVVVGLSKNPIGLSEVFRSLIYINSPKSIMFILNDNPSDGRDISWIWDADFNEVLNIPNLKNFYCSGTRAEDIAIRLKYINMDLDKIKIFPTENKAELNKSVEEILSESEDSYIIGTFTAMPEARKIIVNKIKGEKVGN